MDSRQQSPLAQVFWPALAALVLHAALLGAYLARTGELGALVCVCQEKAGRYPFEQIQSGFPKGGYDGQFYYILARAPWSVHNRAEIDTPWVRHLRILYPLLGWMLSGGDAIRLLYVLPAINLAAVAGMAAMGAFLALRCGLNPWWGFLLPIAVNAGLPALRDLTDNLSTLALCAMLAIWLTRGPVWLLAWAGAAAVFSREQNLLILLLLAGIAGYQGRRGVVPALAAVVLLWLGWVVTLRAIYGHWPFMAGGNFDWPLAGMLQALAGSEGLKVLGNGLALAYLVALALLAIHVARSQCDPLVVGMALAGAVLVLVGGVCIYASPWSYARVFVWLPIGLWAAGMQTGQRWLAWTAAAGGVWPLVAVAQVWLA